MKKSLILGSATLALTLSLGIAAPTFATNTSSTSITTAPTRAEINQAISEAKALSQYHEYAELIQAVQSASTYRLQSAITAIDNSIATAGLSATELTKIATSLPRYQTYKYLYNLVNYTETWLTTSYYSASSADKQEAYDAVNDAVISCRLLFPTKTAKPAASAKTTNTTARVAEPNITPVAPATETAEPTTTPEVIPTSQTSEPVATVMADGHEDNLDTGVQISVKVVNNPELPDAVAPENTDETENDSTVATSLTYAATTFSIAGAALATKRETRRSNRKLHRI